MTTSKFSFKIIKKSSQSNCRVGVLQTPHGKINTPVFMPVGTLGAMKGVLAEQLLKEEAQIILANTYHLFLRPGIQVLKYFMGLHEFSNWHRPLLTDSGGFQVYSLSKLNKLTEDGVSFRSHLNGDKIFFSPEKVIEIQKIIGSDIIMPLDECLPSDASFAKTKNSLELTTRWAKRSKKYFSRICDSNKQVLFGIIQGGMYPELRESSADQMTDLNFFGYSIGGLSVGEGKEKMYPLITETVKHIPQNKPRYLMGVGNPEDLTYAMDQGIDMFDCVLPTRLARHGAVLSINGTYHIKNKQHEFSKESLSECCTCYTCRNYHRGYIRHLWRSGELNAMTFLSIHNICYLINLVDNKRKSVLAE